MLFRSNRKSQIGTGDRSERIRTYNFPQGRITDHRIGFTLHSLDNFLSGDIDEMIEALAIADKEAKLAGEGLHRPRASYTSARNRHKANRLSALRQS